MLTPPVFIAKMIFFMARTVVFDEVRRTHFWNPDTPTVELVSRVAGEVSGSFAAAETYGEISTMIISASAFSRPLVSVSFLPSSSKTVNGGATEGVEGEERDLEDKGVEVTLVSHLAFSEAYMTNGTAVNQMKDKNKMSIFTPLFQRIQEEFYQPSSAWFCPS